METRHLLVAIVGQIIILCIIAYIFIYFPVSTKILEADLDNVIERLDGFSKYDIDPDDLRYLKVVGKLLVNGIEVNQSNLELLFSLTKFYFSLIVVSIFLIFYFSVLLFKNKKGTCVCQSKANNAVKNTHAG